jgi:hypothetical protein
MRTALVFMGVINGNFLFEVTVLGMDGFLISDFDSRVVADKTFSVFMACFSACMVIRRVSFFGVPSAFSAV